MKSRERRLPRDHVDDAPDGVGAVQHRGRTAHDLDPFDRVDVHQGRELAEVLLAPRVVEPEAVGEQQNPLPLQPADLRTPLVHAHTRHVEPGQRPEQVGDRVRHLTLDPDALHHGHRLRHGRRLPRPARSRHHDGVQDIDDGIGRRGSILGHGGGGSGQREDSRDECGQNDGTRGHRGFSAEHAMAGGRPRQERRMTAKS